MKAFRPEPHSDRGSAMIITLMVLALVTALSTTVAVVSINNLQSSFRAQQAGAALSAADAGISQAMAFLRNSGVRDLGCSSATPSSTACGRPWGTNNRTRVTRPGKAGQAYEVWIEAVLPFPANDPGTYRIHSTGTAAGSASRAVSTDVQVTTTPVPKGIFARTISGGGSASVTRESVFSTGCVYNRSKISMSGTDVAYGIPVGVHSSQIITNSNGSGQYCPNEGKPIHRAAPQYQAANPCNTDYPYDQDRLGGDLSSTSCASTQSTYATYYGSRDLNGDGTTDVHGSLLKDDATLSALYGVKSPPLTQTQIAQMRTIAVSQGNYWTKAAPTDNAWKAPDEANAVMFFDLAQSDPGGTVDLNDITGFGRDPILSATDPACTTRSLIIIVEGGNVKLNSNQKLSASLFLTSAAPYGQVLKATGTSSFIGTIYADTMNLVGTTNLSLDECFLSNVSPALLDFRLGAYRELDR